MTPAPIAFLDDSSPLLGPAAAVAADRVVLVHCSAGSARQWQTLTQQLDGFRVTPVDLHGHGDRPGWHGAGPLSLAQEAAIIREACPGDEPFHLVGHSYGGAVALRYALSFPERLLSLTLIEPSCFHILRTAKGADPELLEEVRGVAGAVIRGVICGDYREGMERFINYWSGPGSWTALSETKRAQMTRLAFSVAHHYWGLIEERTPLSAYAAVDVPTLILHGTLSPRPSRTIVEILANTLPRARSRAIPGASHMSPITHSDIVNALIREHLLAHATLAETRDAAVVGGALPCPDQAAAPAM